MLAGKGDDGLVGALALLQVVADGMVVLDGALDAAGDDHGPRLAADLAQGDHLLVEVIDHDLGLQADGVVVRLDVAAQLLLRPLGVELRIVLDRLDQLVVAVDRRVALQHVQDEALLDGLLHGVAVEGPVLDLLALGVGLAEDLQRLVLGRGGEGEVAGVGQHLARFHDAVDDVLDGLLLFRCAGFAEGHAHRGRGAPALAGVGLVDDDGKAPAAVLVADLVQDEGELLHRGDDDLLAALDEPAQVARVLGMADGGRHLGELLDRVADLLVQDAPVGDDDDRVEDRLAVLLQADELVGQPGDGVASCRCRPSAGSGSAARRRAAPHRPAARRTTSSWW